MKNIKMNAAKSLVLIALLCSVAFADGEQGSGGFSAGGSCVATRSMDGEQGSGGYADGEQGSGGFKSEGCSDTNYSEGFIAAVYSFIDEIF